MAATEEEGTVRCGAPHVSVGAPVLLLLEVSVNGVSSATSAVQFRYHTEPKLQSINPRSGVLSGGGLCKIQGTGLWGGSEYVCAFGTVLSPASYTSGGDVRCYAPAAVLGGRDQQAAGEM